MFHSYKHFPQHVPFLILAQVDHKDTNWSFLTLLMTFQVIQYHSAWIMLMHNHTEST